MAPQWNSSVKLKQMPIDHIWLASIVFLLLTLFWGSSRTNIYTCMEAPESSQSYLKCKCPWLVNIEIIWSAKWSWDSAERQAPFMFYLLIHQLETRLGCNQKIRLHQFIFCKGQAVIFHELQKQNKRIEVKSIGFQPGKVSLKTLKGRFFFFSTR